MEPVWWVFAPSSRFSLHKEAGDSVDRLLLLTVVVLAHGGQRQPGGTFPTIEHAQSTDRARAVPKLEQPRCSGSFKALPVAPSAAQIEEPDDPPSPPKGIRADSEIVDRESIKVGVEGHEVLRLLGSFFEGIWSLREDLLEGPCGGVDPVEIAVGIRQLGTQPRERIKQLLVFYEPGLRSEDSELSGQRLLTRKAHGDPQRVPGNREPLSQRLTPIGGGPDEVLREPGKELLKSWWSWDLQLRSTGEEPQEIPDFPGERCFPH